MSDMGTFRVGIAIQQVARELVRVALQQLQAHVREAALEFGHHRRQRVARLRMRDPDGEAALRAMRELLAHRLQVGNFRKDAVDRGEHLAAGVGHRGEAPALAHEDRLRTRLEMTEHGYTTETARDMSRGGLEQCLDKMAGFVSGPTG